MSNNIGEIAGLVWNYLSENGESTITNLKKELNLKAEDTGFALGWLAREEKVSFVKKGATTKISLK